MTELIHSNLRISFDFLPDMPGAIRKWVMKATKLRKSMGAPVPSLSIRIDLDPTGRIGPGKIELLESIGECGSISAAGRVMGMSYKKAWELVDDINRTCGQAAVARQTGGKHGGGAVLTPFGSSLVAKYRLIEQAAAAAARGHLVALRSEIKRLKQK